MCQRARAKQAHRRTSSEEKEAKADGAKEKARARARSASLMMPAGPTLAPQLSGIGPRALTGRQLHLLRRSGHQQQQRHSHRGSRQRSQPGHL